MSYSIHLEADLGGPDPIHLGLLDWNYTSNVSCMWYRAMPPDGLAGFERKLAGECLPVLLAGIRSMEESPAEYEAMNPSNGWGSYASQLDALRRLVVAFEAAPRAIVRVHW